MEYQAFEKQLKIGWAQGKAFVIHGEEEYWKQRAERALNGLLNEQFSDMNRNTLDNPTVEELIAACETLPFFDEVRLTIVKNTKLFAANKGDKSVERLCLYLQSLPATVCLAFLENGKLDGRKAGFKSIAKVCTVVECNTPEEYETAQLVAGWAAEQGVEITSADARYLVEFVGNDLFRLRGEVEKLASCCPKISRREIDRLVVPSTESSVFRMMDALDAGQMEKGLAIYRKLEQNSEPVPLMIGALAQRFRLILQACELQKAGKGSAALNIMGGGYAAKYAIKASKRHTPASAGKALHILAETDYRIKSGREKDYPALLEALCRIYGGEKR